jgi:ferredoxin-NADP reductase
MRITVKALGGHSAAVSLLRPGTRVWAEGPYGSLTADRRTAARSLLIAGGVGITPIRALLEEPWGGHVVVLYRVRDERDAVLLREVRDLVARRGGRLHLLTGRTSAGARPFEPVALHSMVPDIADRDVYVCGPRAMTDTVLESLRRLRVPNRQVHAEKFTLA